MTNAEAIETLRANYPDACFEQLREAVDAAIEALKARDVAGDTISRQAAIDALIKWYGCEPTDIGAFENIIEKLPSAQPEQKTGRWLTHSDFPDRLICSECGVQFDMWHWESKQMHFCPNCGAKMEV